MKYSDITTKIKSFLKILSYFYVNLHLIRRLSSLLNDSPSELVARQAYLPATFLVTLCKTKFLSLFIVLAEEFRFNVRP